MPPSVQVWLSGQTTVAPGSSALAAYESAVANDGAVTVALDITVSPRLKEEGLAREFVNRIQKIRKESGFDVTDRIEVKVAANNGISQSLAKYNDYICAEILADKLEITSTIDGGTEIEVNDNLLKVIVLKNG